MDADNGGVDHLDSGIMGSGKCVYDAAPDTSPTPADEPVVASGVWAKRHRQITPRCSRSQDPEDAIEDTSVVHPRNATWLVRQHRPYGSPFIVGEFVAHDSSPQSGSLNHRGLTHRKELLARPWFGVFGAGADINLPTILNEKSKMTQSSGKARYVTLFRDTAVKLPVKRIIVGPADGADERSRALSRRLQ